MLASPEHELLDANPGTFNVISSNVINIERFLPAMLCKRGLCRRTVSVRPSVRHVRVFSRNE